MPHFFRNWKEEDMRKCILNGIVWSAGAEIPKDGMMWETVSNEKDYFVKEIAFGELAGTGSAPVLPGAKAPIPVINSK
jgi:hypothetical protein